jgi:hypothetical protein
LGSIEPLFAITSFPLPFPSTTVDKNQGEMQASATATKSSIILITATEPNVYALFAKRLKVERLNYYDSP